jgi:hypothetical protein
MSLAAHDDDAAEQLFDPRGRLAPSPVITPRREPARAVDADEAGPALVEAGLSGV